jgi:hypothetical protein
MAAAQESLALASRPSAWGAAKRLAYDRWAFRNTSGRSIVLEGVRVEPGNAAALLSIDVTLPHEFRAGELMQLSTERRSDLSVEKLTLVWRFSDETLKHDSDRTIP